MRFKSRCFVGSAVIIIFFIISNLILFDVFVYTSYKFLSKYNNLNRIRWQLEQNILPHIKRANLQTLSRQTIERLFIVSNPNETFSSVGVDVSGAGEASFIYRKILSSGQKDYHKLVVDIGANDGYLSSNSFNFIQWGWDAILVEPMEDQLEHARRNVGRYTHSPLST